MILAITLSKELTADTRVGIRILPKNNIKLISKPVKTEFCRLALDRKRALSQQMFNEVFLNLIISFCIVRRPI